LEYKVLAEQIQQCLHGSGWVNAEWRHNPGMQHMQRVQSPHAPSNTADITSPSKMNLGRAQRACPHNTLLNLIKNSCLGMSNS